jgi:phosphoribosylglycinamide formyltransferase-1
MPIAVLLSGGGSTMQNLADHIAAGRLNAAIRLVVSSRAGVAGIDKAVKLNLPHAVVPRRDFADVQSFGDAVWRQVRAAEVRYVVLAGWMSLLPIPDDFGHRVVNIHPALLPAFGGPGMFGHHVHEAVLAAGCKVTGCTVHFCDQTYDTGPILAQRCYEDTAESLATRVQTIERELYPQVIQWLAEDRITVTGRRSRLKPARKPE